MWRGVPKPVALLDPSAGQPATYVPSQGEIECVRAVTFLLTTSSATAARRPVVRFLDGQGVPVAVSASPFTLAKSLSQVVSLYVGGTQFGANDADAVGGPLYERWLDGHVTLQVGADNLAAGDTITELRLDVVGYPDEWYDTDDG